MGEIEYFDYQKVAKEAGIQKEALEEIKKEVKKEFPSDKMMFELHVLRVVKSSVRHKKQEITADKNQ
jgi:hypothetical protein